MVVYYRERGRRGLSEDFIVAHNKVLLKAISVAIKNPFASFLKWKFFYSDFRAKTFYLFLYGILLC
jgi:hypothetical protein